MSERQSSPPAVDGEVVLAATGIERTYRHGDIVLPVLYDLDLQVHRGEWVACTGRSGSGKSTLLHVLGLLDSADAGTYVLAGHDVSGLDDAARARLRNELLGFVFQLHNLLPRTSALENVATPLIYRGVRRAERLRRAQAALEAVGLADRADHDPGQLSGGQMQRVAIARALVGDPELLLVDEPTGNLDLAATNDVLELLDQVHAEGRTIVMITHEQDVAAHADRRLVLRDGRLHDEHADGGIAMTLAHPRRSNRRLGAGLGACLVLLIATAALVAGCGGTSKAATASRRPHRPGPCHGATREPRRQRDGQGAAHLDQEQGHRQGPGRRQQRLAGGGRPVGHAVLLQAAGRRQPGHLRLGVRPSQRLSLSREWRPGLLRLG